MPRGTRVLRPVKEERGESQWGNQRTPTVVQALRVTHHKIAQMIAGGMKYTDVARIMAMTPQRIQQLLADPTFQNLIAEYRDLDMGETGDFIDTYRTVLMGNMLKAELHVQRKLEQFEEEGETLPVRDAISISRDAADRLGVGKASVRVNANLDFAAQLEKAVARSKTVTIMGTATTNPSTSGVASRQERLLSPPVMGEEITVDRNSPPLPGGRSPLPPSSPTTDGLHLASVVAPELSASPVPLGRGREEVGHEVSLPPPAIKRRF